MTPRGFPKAEYQDRVTRAQAMMAQAGLGALMLTTEPDVRYFTGFLTRFWESPTRPWFVVLPAKGDPVAVIPAIGAPLMARGWLRDIRTWRAPDLNDDGVSLLIDTLRDVGGPVGLPCGLESHVRMPLADYHRIRDAVPLRDDAGVMRRLRMIKSEAEIAKVSDACTIAGRAFARVPEIAGEGVPLDQIFREFQRLCLAEGADWVPYLAGGAGPGGYGDVISPATETPLARGDVLMLDTGLVRDGYFCDFDRNFVVGRNDQAQGTHGQLQDAVQAAMELAQPGRRASELFAAMDKVLTGGAGGAEAGRYGHGLGMQLTEGLSLIPDDHTVLEPGMILTLEPGVETGPGHMMVHEENIVIRNGPPEALSPFAGPELGVI